MSTKRLLSTVFSAVIGLCAASAASAATLPPIRIMPLGDSITAGYNVPDGYRAPLYASLTSLGYSVDFVGTQADNNSGSIPDPNHEGHSGWTIGGIDASVNGFLDSVADPDVILLHLGTNDANDLGNFAGAIDRLDALITKIAAKRPYAHIIVTSLLPRTETDINTAIDTQFNPFVPAKVAAQAALGRRVTFLDMHAYLTPADLADTAHPNQAGYDKMAAAWLPAITGVIAPSGVLAPPALVSSRSLSATQVGVTFNKPVDPATATDTANYALSGGLAVTGAALDAGQRTVTLATSPQAVDTAYTLTVNDVTDLSSPTPLAIADNSTITFSGVTPRGYLNNVAESADYALVYSLDIADYMNLSATPVSYAVDNHLVIGAFSRVAYYMELQKPGGELTYMWASMDAFTNDVAALGVPTLASGVTFQKKVANLTIESNDPGLTTGTGLSGNLEFWPYNYLYANSGIVPGADNGACDFDDTMAGGGNYSCMQLHNYVAGQTLFAYNNWNGAGGAVDVGIGNSPAPILNGVDWTFSNNGPAYTVKTLQVLVLRDSDTTAPTLVSAHSDLARTGITVRFSEPLAPSSVNGACFALDSGAQVVSATLAANQRDVTLVTTRLPGVVTLSVTGIRDSAAANPIAPGSTIAVAGPALPSEITANVGALAAGYEVVCSLDIPINGTFDSPANPYSFDQRSGARGFDRVAYYLELQKADGTVQFIWTAMDAFTADAAKLGIPVGGTAFQQVVTNLDVLSNVDGIVNGTGITTGNIEFWPSNFGMVNELPIITGASDTAFDFGDGGGSAAGGGHGCMQVHNYGAAQTLFGINHFNGGNTIGLGIGNNPPPYAIVPDPDWTATYNAGTYLRRKLHVLVRPATYALPAEVTANVPASAGYQLACSINIPVIGNFNNSSADYFNDNRTAIGPFSRVAYYLELKKSGEAATFIWTAMDAFTADAMKLGVPVIGTIFQQKVTRLDVLSNVGGIVNGTGFSTGNIEFWPSNYGYPNTLNLPNANPDATDFDDSGASSTWAGWGSMQVHNYGALQTLFAINSFNNNSVIGLGIGNNPNPGSVPDWPFNDPDWSFNFNAGSFESRVLHVLVLPGAATGDTAAPTLTGALSTEELNSVLVSFSEPLADSAAAAGNFGIDNGVAVTGATLSPDKTGVYLATTALTAGQAYTVSVTGVRDRTSSGNQIAAGSAISFTVEPAALPAAIAGSVPEAADYSLVYKLAAPDYGNFVPNGAPYSLDQSLFPQVRRQPFDRIAYCMELVSGGVTQWAYVSLDAFTGEITKIGVPTAARGAVFQQFVNNMNVYASANVAVTTGTAIATGNIEFWASGFGPENNLNVPNALGGQVFDFGDSGGSADPSYGSMQIHNHGDAAIAGHTIMSLSRFSQGSELALGLGNNTVFTYGGGYEDPDWTLHPNATTYTTKNLYVLARWGGTGQGTTPSLISQPADRSVWVGTPVRLYVEATGATYYQWRRDGVAIGGANQAWLEIAPAAATDSGTYDVLVYGSGSASVVSRAATLRVSPRGTVIRIL